MANQSNIKNKVSELGGIKPHPLCKNEFTDNDRDTLILEAEKKLALALPNSYKEFYKLYGASSFNKSIKVACIERPPIAEDDKLVTVDYFYSLTGQGNCSVFYLLEKYSDQLPINLLPICDSEPGDLICISLDDKDYGKIYYWYHEGRVGEETFLISNNFEEFILKLKILENNIEDERVKNIKVNASPELLEMLKRSGFGPKK